MIYKSVKYLNFMIDQVTRYSELDAELFIIANDASSNVLMELEHKGCHYMDYRDPRPNDYYLNRVYRAWNCGGMNAPGDI